MDAHAARRQGAAHPVALAGMWRDGTGSRRMAGPAEQSLTEAGMTEPRPLRRQSHWNIQLCCGEASNDVGSQACGISAHCALRARDIRFSLERAFICTKSSSSAIPARCDIHLRPPGQDFWSGRLQMSRACWLLVKVKGMQRLRGSKSAWSARNAKHHVGRGLVLPSPS
jgi:hypothetical protein